MAQSRQLWKPRKRAQGNTPIKMRSPIPRTSLAGGVAIMCAVLAMGGNTAQAAGVVGTGTAAGCTDAALDAALDISTGTGTKTITTDTTIDGEGLITISGGNSVRVFSVNSGGNFTVLNLTIANGSIGDGSGGGIFNDGRSLTVSNSTFTGNSAGGSYGGDGPGGGIFNGSGALTVTNSTFTGNSARGKGFGGLGGGIYNGSGALTVTNSTFTGNFRGGIHNDSGSVTVANSTFTGNLAFGGGGISNGGALTVTNSTFTGNSNDGIFNFSDGSALLRNTIVANGIFRNCEGSITDGGHNLDDGTSCGFNAANSSLSNTDPQLDPAGLQNNGGPTQTVALCTAVGIPDPSCTGPSPAIDAGDQAVCAMAPVNNRDQRGSMRPGSGHTQCSIGAYEADAAAPEACIGDCGASGAVTIINLLTMVNIALGNATVSACVAGDSDRDGAIGVNEILSAVNNALNACPVPPISTPATTPTATATVREAPQPSANTSRSTPIPAPAVFSAARATHQWRTRDVARSSARRELV